MHFGEPLIQIVLVLLEITAKEITTFLTQSER